MANNKENYALLLLRVVVAAVFLYHGVPKAMDWTMAMNKFVAMGFPGFLGPLVGVLEVIAGVMVLVGFYHMWANYLLMAIIAVAIVGVQIPGAIEAGKLLPAGLERDLLLLAGGWVLAVFGAGDYAVSDN